MFNFLSSGSWFSIIKQLADIWAFFGVGLLIGASFIAAGWFLPVIRQLCVGLAVAAFVATAAFGWGVKQERDVYQAREARAEVLRQQRDAEQTRIAKAAEAKSQAVQDAFNRREQELESDYEKRLASRKAPSCILTPDDLR